MNHNEEAYLQLLTRILDSGYRSDSRAGETYSLPGQGITLSLYGGDFPMLTTRKMFPQGVFGELAGFVRGAEDLATYEKYGCHYWRDNAANWWVNKDKPESEWLIGKSYGSLWRNFHGVDQLANVIESLRADPYSRRHVVSAWDPSAEACLPSCHIMFQFYVRQSRLHCHVYMRSVDLCVGLPSDIVLYALLTHLVAKDTGLVPATLTFSFGDAHIYTNHIDQFINEQLRRVPYKAPTLLLAEQTSTLNFLPEDVTILDYKHHPAVKYQFNA